MPTAVYVAGGAAGAPHVGANGLRVAMQAGCAQRRPPCPHRSPSAGCGTQLAGGGPLRTPRKGATPQRMQDRPVLASGRGHPRNLTRNAGASVVRAKCLCNGEVKRRSDGKGCGVSSTRTMQERAPRQLVSGGWRSGRRGSVLACLVGNPHRGQYWPFAQEAKESLACELHVSTPVDPFHWVHYM